MYLVFDIGNSNIVCGVFNLEKKSYDLIKQFRISTPKKTTTDEIAFNVINLLKQNQVDKEKITAGIFCSVVPSLNHNITKMMNLYFNINIEKVSLKEFADFEINYSDKDDLGIDRLINLKAGLTLNHLPQITIDLGTANTIDVLDTGKNYLGGMIIPGIAISLEALIGNTSKLPKIELRYPDKILGNSTQECMQNGIFYFNALALEKIIDEIIKKKFKNREKEVSIILTGGLANFISSAFKKEVKVIPDLTLKGLKIILDERNN